MALILAIQKRLQDLADEIKSNMSAKGVNASGRTASSIKVRTDANRVAVVIGGDKTAELSTLEKGISPEEGAKEFAKGTLISAIYQWSNEKNISFRTDRQRQSFAYLTARKIKMYGTLRYNANIDIYSVERERAIKDLQTICKKETLNILMD